MTVTVVSIERVNMKAIKAFAVIKIGPLTIHGVRVIKTDKAPTVYLPKTEKPRPGPDGKETYPPVVEADPALMAEIRRVVLDVWQHGFDAGMGGKPCEREPQSQPHQRSLFKTPSRPSSPAPYPMVTQAAPSKPKRRKWSPKAKASMKWNGCFISMSQPEPFINDRLDDLFA